MLKIRYKNNKYNSVWLVEPMISIGRSATNDLIIDDTDVADRHIEVHVLHETLTLKNLHPLKPIKVNDTDVTGACTLKEDDEIIIGGIELIVIDPKRESKVVIPDAVNATQIRTIPSTGWALKANHIALANRVFPLKDITVIGRADECDISLTASHLSRRHAQLQIVDGALFVKDLGSSNGTFLNGKQVLESRVKRGDELRFDSLVFGVMGPADELAKTTVRAYSATDKVERELTEKEQFEAEMSMSKGTARPISTASAQTQSSHDSYSPSWHKKPEPKTLAGKFGLIAVAILMVVVIGVFLTKH
jgi:pSer/pThr/pTyr-binding forkhead associated (FHA) protein